ncbi:MAG: hypothetical protein KAT58_08235 [candidate division Zixibacteria bacterium]|nr:hypothetical protein [candidate division Zixibacteria bacterium]
MLLVACHADSAKEQVHFEDKEAVMPVSIPPGLKQAASGNVNPPEEEWWIRELTDSYPWLHGEEIYWIIDSESNSAMVLKGLAGEYECLNRPDKAGRIGEVIAVNLGEVPSESLNVLDMARLLMEWYRDPRGHIANPEFLESERDVLDTWMMGTETDINVLRTSCVPVTFTNNDDGTWLLVFNALNRLGGVEKWTVSGKSGEFEITAIEIEILKENGTFYYPDEL